MPSTHKLSLKTKQLKSATDPTCSEAGSGKTPARGPVRQVVPEREQQRGQQAKHSLRHFGGNGSQPLVLGSGMTGQPAEAVAVAVAASDSVQQADCS